MAGALAEEALGGLFIPLDDAVEDWETFVNFEPRFPTPSLPAAELGFEFSTRQAGSTPQHQQALVRPPALLFCVQKPRKQDEI